MTKAYRRARKANPKEFEKPTLRVPQAYREARRAYQGVLNSNLKAYLYETPTKIVFYEFKVSTKEFQKPTSMKPPLKPLFENSRCQGPVAFRAGCKKGGKPPFISPTFGHKPPKAEVYFFR
eukprot:3919935-Amphidinium_carterae.1